MSNGILEEIFDFNRDGEMNAFERAAEIAFLEEQDRENTRENSDEDNEDFD